MRTTLLTALAAAMMLTGAQPALAQSGHDLFQQALVMERASGQLQEAIVLYGGSWKSPQTIATWSRGRSCRLDGVMSGSG